MNMELQNGVPCITNHLINNLIKRCIHNISRNHFDDCFEPIKLIAQTEITVKNGKLKQNPGWDAADAETQYKVLY